jgi:topoisomerase-4 subunit A
MIMSDVAQNITETSLPEALSERYLSYALSTILSRSLPDVRDGLKPVHRRLLYAMRLLKLQPSSMPKKSARVVGDVIGRFHPHGEIAIYDALVRLAQDFSVRYPLIDGHGNFGNIDGDNAAAMRYTEARLTPFAEALMEGLDEDSIDFKPTYDGDTVEPIVLPAAFPNLLANGATGIAVGMATSIPPHNATELCDALLYLIDHPNAEDDAVIRFIVGPDFPTGGVLVESRESIEEAYRSGRGSFRVRAKWEIESLKSGTYQIVVTQIPFQVSKSRLIEKIAQLWMDKKFPLMADIRDESSEDIRIVIEPKSRAVAPEILMESLFRSTDLECRIPLNLNVVDRQSVPRVVSLKTALQEYLGHRLTVFGRRSKFRLANIHKRLGLLEGYIIAYLNLDEVIQIIREQDEPAAALMQRFGLLEEQAEAILNMRLRALRKLEEEGLKREQAALLEEKGVLESIMADESKQWSKIQDEVKALKKVLDKDTVYGPRRTMASDAPMIADIPVDAMVEREPVTIICSKLGWIRGIKGHHVDASELKYKDGDEGRFIIACMTTDRLIIVSSGGRSFTVLADKISRGRGQGDAIRLLVELEQDEDILYMGPYKGEGQHMLLVGSDSRGFRIDEKSLVAQTKQGRQIYNSVDGAKLKLCLPTEGDHVAIIGSNRKLLVFPIDEIPIMARGRGVVLQKYKEGRLTDIRFLTLSEGLVWASGGRTRTEANLLQWLGHRGQVGRMPPMGFPRMDLFGS